MQKQQNLKIKSGRTLSSIIDSIVKESIKTSLYHNGLDEKEKQKSILDEEDVEASVPSNENEQNSSSKTMDSEKEKLKKGDITAKDIVDKLNTIRSGKSFKDSAIASKMEQYIESLSREERIALLAFLKGLAQIITGEIDPSAASDPSEKPSDIKMQKGEKHQEKSIKPNIIKAPEKSKTEKKPSSEDTSAPVPITPKKK